MIKTYRQGAIGALLDIYEQTISDFKKVLEDIPDNALPMITDPQTTNENCRSIQAILSHVVTSAYYYATYIYNLRGNNTQPPEKTFHLTIKEYEEDLTNMFTYTVTVFEEIKDDELSQSDDSLKINAHWGKRYDIEQMMEHAIVHIMRHHRQLEKIKQDQLT
jgi:uncharacterized damage-inducible protein DinB